METTAPPLADRLRRALDDAETDVQDMGHVWMAGDQLVGNAALRLIARDRALLDNLTQAEAAMSAAVTGYVGDENNGTLIAATARCKEARLHAERAAAFWADLDADVSGGGDEAWHEFHDGPWNGQRIEIGTSPDGYEHLVAHQPEPGVGEWVPTDAYPGRGRYVRTGSYGETTVMTWREA